LDEYSQNAGLEDTFAIIAFNNKSPQRDIINARVKENKMFFNKGTALAELQKMQ